MWTRIKNNLVKSHCGNHEIYKVKKDFILFSNGARIGKTERLRDTKRLIK